jgi:hypothetical protein
MLQVFFLLICAGVLAAQESFTFGVKGGIRLTDDLEGFATSESKRYVVGGMLTAPLPLGFRFEFDALYRHDAYRSEETDIIGDYFASRVHGNSWEFPLLLRRPLRHGVYVSAGYVPRTIHGSGHLNSITLTSLTPPNNKIYSERDIPAEWNTTHGLAGAAGIEKHFGRLRVAPEIRYTQWFHPAVNFSGSHGIFVSSRQDQMDLMLAITF